MTAYSLSSFATDTQSFIQTVPSELQSNMVDQSKNNPNLVKATELPTHGNPRGPKNEQDQPESGLEVQIRSMRVALAPYLSPIYSAYERTSDFVSIGVAHSQSGIERLAENQSSLVNALIISTSGLLGIALARRRGIFKKLLFGSVFFGGALAACYPKDAGEKAQLMLYIAKNKLPDLAKQQYEKLTPKKESSQQDTQPKDGAK